MNFLNFVSAQASPRTSPSEQSASCIEPDLGIKRHPDMQTKPSARKISARSYTYAPVKTNHNHNFHDLNSDSAQSHQHLNTTKHQHHTTQSHTPTKRLKLPPKKGHHPSITLLSRTFWLIHPAHYISIIQRRHKIATLHNEAKSSLLDPDRTSALRAWFDILEKGIAEYRSSVERIDITDVAEL